MIKYNLHDSLIEKVDYLADNRRVEIRIELCNWQQSGYRDSEPEMLSIDMIFEEVERYELSLENYVFCSDEILNVVELDDQTIKIIFLTENGAEEMIIKAKKVSYIRNSD